MIVMNIECLQFETFLGYVFLDVIFSSRVDKKSVTLDMNATIVINARRFMAWKPNLECRLIVIYGIQVNVFMV